MAPPSTSNLKQLVEYQSKSERFEMFDGQGQLVLIVARFAIKLLSQDDKIIESLKSLEESATVSWSYSHHSQQDRKFSKSFWKFVEQLKVFFKVPNVMTTAEPNELVAAFIDLLLEIMQEIQNLQLYFIHRVDDSMEKLKMELKFLVTFLGDTPSQPMELKTTKNTLAAIEGVANEVGSFFYSFFLSKKRISVIEMKQKLDGLLGQVEKLKESIKIHCVTIAQILPNGTTAKIALVSPFLVGSVVDYLFDLMNRRDERIVDLIDEIRTIYHDLTLLHRHPKFREFSTQIGDVAYEVEYILESFSPQWYLTIRVPHIKRKIQHIEMSIEEMNIKNHDVGQEALLLAPRFSSFRDTLVGMEDEEMKIKDLLIGGTSRRQVISICGMPGLGKTTIARKIYNDSNIFFHFDKRVWCSVSGTYHTRNVLIEMLICLGHHNRETLAQMEDAHLANNVHESLKGSRYLIVIDDIQNLNVWDYIKCWLPDDSCGSRILFTSQFKDMAMRASPSSLIHSLRFLNDDECWNLLQLKLFCGEPCPPQLEYMGNKIARSCFGLPVVVVKVAAVLANMPREKSLWTKSAEFISSQEIDEYMRFLYNHLPIQLRPCFLYFGVFEKGREIPVHKLLMLWDAEGFIENSEDPEDLAMAHLMDLISRSLVLVAAQRSGGGVKACILHDTMHNMCLKMAEKENFMKVIKDRLSIYEQHHRLSIHSHSIPPFSRPFGLHVLSLLGNLPDPSAFMFGNLKCLKVLDLSTIDLSLYNLTGSESFGVLKFLSVSSIPSSIEIFKNLEFLFVDNKQVVEIPTILLNMVKLRHVHFNGSAQFSESWCLEASSGERIQISYLQNLSSLFIYDENDEKILRMFPRLRTLKGRFTVFWDSIENLYRYPSLNFLKQLESLNITFLPSYASDDIIPESMSFPSRLRKLTLRNFDLSRKHMKTIAKLRNLKVLKLRDDTIDGKQWDTSEDVFTKLKYLELDSLQIEHWNASDDNFPNLKHLVLVRCQTLEEIPSTLGDIRFLKKIEIRGCSKSVEASARRIQKEQEECEWFQVIISDF